MSEFKVGDWVTVKGTLASDKFKLTDKEVELKEILLAHFRFGEETWSHWQPKVGELIINKDIDGIITIEKYSKQLDIYPFIGEITWLHKTD